MKKWVKQKGSNQEVHAAYTLGERNIELPSGSAISVTRGEGFNRLRLVLNECLNRFVMKTMTKNEDVLYAELSGPLPGGVSQTVTVWKSGKRMNQFRQSGMHNVFRILFRWVFYSGKVQSYFLTWKYEGPLPPPEEITAFVKTYGRHFDGGKLIRKGSIPVNRKPGGAR